MSIDSIHHLVGGLVAMNFIFPLILGISNIPIDEVIFFRGVALAHQPDSYGKRGGLLAMTAMASWWPEALPSPSGVTPCHSWELWRFISHQSGISLGFDPSPHWDSYTPHIFRSSLCQRFTTAFTAPKKSGDWRPKMEFPMQEDSPIVHDIHPGSQFLSHAHPTNSFSLFDVCVYIVHAPRFNL